MLHTATEPICTDQPRIIISMDHYKRLYALAESAMHKMPSVANQLMEEIERAVLLPQEDIPPNVVRIGSVVTFRNDFTGDIRTVKLVLPSDADISKGRVSILTLVGAALIGMIEGNRINWETASGQKRTLTVFKVVNDSDERAVL